MRSRRRRSRSASQWRPAGYTPKVLNIEKGAEPVQFAEALGKLSDGILSITATAREKLIELEPFDVNSTMDLNQYLLGLTFKLRAYHGINARDLPATKVQLLGPPAKVPCTPARTASLSIWIR